MLKFEVCPVFFLCDLFFFSVIICNMQFVDLKIKVLSNAIE